MAEQKKNRIITVDGVQYDLDTGRAVNSMPAPVKPASPTVTSTSHRQQRGMDIVRVPRPKSQQQPATEEVVSFQAKAKRSIMAHPHAVSHPSLPLSASHVTKRGKSWWQAVLKPSLVQRSTSKTNQLAFVQTLCSPVTWLILGLPLLLSWVSLLPTITLTQVLDKLHVILNPATYWVTVWSLIGGIVLLGILYAGVNIFGLAIYAIRVHELDNRLSRVGYLLKQNLARLDRVFFNWLANICLILLWTLLLVLTAYLVMITHQSAIILLHNYLLVALGVMFLAGLTVLVLARFYMRALLATVDQKLSFIRAKAYQLTLRHPGYNITAALVAGIINLAILTLTVVLVWAQYTYLSSHSSTGSVIALTVGGILLTLVLLSIRLSWNQRFWASQYHYLLSKSSGGHIPALLNQDTPPKLRAWPLLRLLLTFLIIIVAVIALALHYEHYAVDALVRFRNAVPTDFTKLIPKNY